MKRKNIPTYFSNSDRKLVSMAGNVNFYEVMKIKKIEEEEENMFGRENLIEILSPSFSPTNVSPFAISNEIVGYLDL